MGTPRQSRAVRVAFADDHPLVREALRALLNYSDGIELVAEARNGLELIEQIAEKHPDVVLVDVKMWPMDGLEAARRIHALHPGVKVLMLSALDDRQTAEDSLRAGAAGFLRKTIPSAELVAKIIAAAPAHLPAGPPVSEPRSRPTKRELEVLNAMAAGKSNKEIARALGIGAQTVKTHVSHILQKLASPDRAGAVAQALRKGLVQ